MKIVRALRQLISEIIIAAPRKAAGSIALTGALSIMEGVSLLLLMPLLVLIGVEETSSMPRVEKWFTYGLATLGLQLTLATGLLFFVLVAGVRAILARIQSALTASVREDLTLALRHRLYRAIANAEWKFLVTRRQSEFVHALDSEIRNIGSASHQVIDLSVLIAVSIIYVALAFHFSFVMSIIVLSCSALLAWIVRGSLREAQSVGGRAVAARSRLHTVISEHVASLKTAKSYGATERQEVEFQQLSIDAGKVSLELTAGQTNLQQRLEFGSTLLLAVIVFVSVDVFGTSPAQLLVLLFIFARLMPRLVSIYRQVQSLATVLPEIDGVTKLEQECLSAAEILSVGQSDISLDKSLQLENVSFTYLRRANTPALHDVNLGISAGLTTAIVGPSGAGKSTLADLLIGLILPTEGRITVDGETLTPDRLASWRQQISYVPQETFLFHATVRANLEWARPGANDDELLESLRLASAYDFVMGLPNGLDTVVGERGVMVSGGERQRLSLARAILRRPRMLVLDEATSSLDSENELRIQQAIESLHQQMTIVLITHRLSTIRHADLIHVLEHGRVVESGSWDMLSRRPDGRFRELCRAQGIDDRPATRLDLVAPTTAPTGTY